MTRDEQETTKLELERLEALLINATQIRVAEAVVEVTDSWLEKPIAALRHAQSLLHGGVPLPSKAGPTKAELQQAKQRCPHCGESMYAPICDAAARELEHAGAVLLPVDPLASPTTTEALPDLAEWQAARYGDDISTRRALAFYRERGWSVDSRNSSPDGKIYDFKAGYKAAQMIGSGTQGTQDAMKNLHSSSDIDQARRAFADKWRPPWPRSAFDADLDQLLAVVGLSQDTAELLFRLRNTERNLADLERGAVEAVEGWSIATPDSYAQRSPLERLQYRLWVAVKHHVQNTVWSAAPESHSSIGAHPTTEET